LRNDVKVRYMAYSTKAAGIMILRKSKSISIFKVKLRRTNI
jgi:hypothetical protein